MKLPIVLLLLLQVLLPASIAHAQQRLWVTEAYLELSSGPGNEFPVFHVLERGEGLTVQSRRTQWFQVMSDSGVEGWVVRQALEQTADAAGQPFHFKAVGESEYQKRRWEIGFMGGDFQGSDVVSAYVGLAFNQNLSAEVMLSKALGTFSSSHIASLNLVSQPFPRWRVSPYLSLGTGSIRTEALTVLVQAEETTFNAANAGVGLKYYVSHRFMLRVEYKNYVLFNNDEDNEEVEEWKAGFAAFF